MNAQLDKPARPHTALQVTWVLALASCLIGACLAALAVYGPHDMLSTPHVVKVYQPGPVGLQPRQYLLYYVWETPGVREPEIEYDIAGADITRYPPGRIDRFDGAGGHRIGDFAWSGPGSTLDFDTDSRPPDRPYFVCVAYVDYAPANVWLSGLAAAVLLMLGGVLVAAALTWSFIVMIRSSTNTSQTSPSIDR